MLRVNLPYQKLESESSLFANGKLVTKRDIDGNDYKIRGVAIESVEVALKDGRENIELTLDKAAFEMVDSAMPEVNFLDDDDIKVNYLPDCEKLVTDVTGARKVIAFDYNVRSGASEDQGRNIRNGQQVQAPARVVHGDYTLSGSLQRLRDLADEYDVKDVLDSKERWRIINVWRNRSDYPVVDHPLALCDAESVSPDDLVVFEIHYPHRIGENYFAMPSKNHQWWWYPKVKKDEAILIKQWDSAGMFATSQGVAGDSTTTIRPSTFSLHTAFQPQWQGNGKRPQRESIEVRCIVMG